MAKITTTACLKRSCAQQRALETYWNQFIETCIHMPKATALYKPSATSIHAETTEIIPWLKMQTDGQTSFQLYNIIVR